MNIRKREFIIVASCTLIVVAILVSFAVLEWWIEASFVEPPPITEQVNITSMTFDVTNNRIMITVSNILDTPMTITEILVNNVNQTSVNPTLPSTITANNIVKYNITLSSISEGYTYQVRLVSLRGNAWLWTATAPS